MDVKVIENDIVLIGSNHLKIFQLSDNEFRGEILINGNIFALTKIGLEKDSIDYILSINNSTSSTHLMLKGLNVVAKFEVQSIVKNIIMEESKLNKNICHDFV